jgi:hypothetical protein
MYSSLRPPGNLADSVVKVVAHESNTTDMGTHHVTFLKC